MNLFISGSNRKKNSYKILNDLMNEDDMLISLSNLNIKYCAGCNSCNNELKDYCIINDDMNLVYDSMIKSDKIIIASPIYFNQITGILKNFIDRLNPFCIHELLAGKKVYLITIGAMTEEENEDVKNNIDNYFKELADIFNFEFKFLRNFTSKINDKVEDNYNNYKEIIEEMKIEIEE